MVAGRYRSDTHHHIVNSHRTGSLPAERPGDADATGSRMSLRKEYSFANSRSQSAAETMTARLASGEVSSPPRLPVLGSVPMLWGCSSSPRQRLPRSVPPSIEAASYRPPSSCAGCSRG
jgi:hypothetical protein